jgi:alpha-beta hydrolase superfamily lysophospholipase
MEMLRAFKKTCSITATITFLASCVPADWGANALLRPARRPAAAEPDLPHKRISFVSGGLTLSGWLFQATTRRKGLILYLHGVGDNRQSVNGVALRFVPKGFDVLAYDSRAHGMSEGQYCTYGFYEKLDVSRALDTVGASTAILFGSSMGAAIAIQAASLDPRVAGVIAQSPFPDLPTIIRERAPWFLSRRNVTEAIALAERLAQFSISDVSPLRAASDIRVPVLLLHGKLDRETSPAHSERIYQQLGGRKKLMIVPGAGHNDVLAREQVWRAIEDFIASL